MPDEMDDVDGPLELACYD